MARPRLHEISQDRLTIRRGGMPVPGTGDQIFPLKVDSSGRFLTTVKNVPWFLMGDGSGQGLCQQLPSDVMLYLQTRASQGFTAIWMHVVCNAQVGSALTTNGATQDGIAPFLGTLDASTVDGGPNYDMSKPNPLYFARLSFICRTAWQLGMAVFLDWWDNDSYTNVYRNNAGANITTFATYGRQQFAMFNNVVHMVGNDFQNWNIVSGDNAIAQSLFTSLTVDTAKQFTTELDFNMSGSSNDTLLAPYVTVSSAYTYYPVYYQEYKEVNQSTVKPVYLIETYYETAVYGGLTPNTATTAMLRRVAWWTMTSGCVGYFYGHNTVYDFASGWQSALTTTAVSQLLVWKNFFTSLNWQLLVPDQTNVVVTSGIGTPTGNLSGRIDTDNYVTAARIPDGSKVLAFVPGGTSPVVDMSKMRGTTAASWVDPVTGTATPVAGSPFANTGSRTFTNPGNNSAGDPDQLLLLAA